MVRGITAVEPRWRRANTRLMVADALRQPREIATRHAPLTFLPDSVEALQFPRD